MATSETSGIAIPGIRFDSDGNPLIETDEGWVRVRAKYPYKPPVPKEVTPSLPPELRLDSEGNPLIQTDFGWQSIVGHSVSCLYTRADKKQGWGDGHVTKAVGQKLTIKVSRPSPFGNTLIETTLSSINATWKLRFPFSPRCGKPITYCGLPAGHNGQCTPVSRSVTQWQPPQRRETTETVEAAETRTETETGTGTGTGETKTETKRGPHARKRKVKKSVTKTSTLTKTSTQTNK